jgi:hypothetical protein
LVAGIIIHPTVNVGPAWDGVPISSDVEIIGISIDDIQGDPMEMSALIGAGCSIKPGYAEGTHVRDSLGHGTMIRISFHIVHI